MLLYSHLHQGKSQVDFLSFFFPFLSFFPHLRTLICILSQNVPRCATRSNNGGEAMASSVSPTAMRSDAPNLPTGAASNVASIQTCRGVNNSANALSSCSSASGPASLASMYNNSPSQAGASLPRVDSGDNRPTSDAHLTPPKGKVRPYVLFTSRFVTCCYTVNLFLFSDAWKLSIPPETTAPQPYL